MPVLDLAVPQKGYRHAVDISGAYVKLLFRARPDAEFVSSFTTWKAKTWPEIQSGIDEYIVDALHDCISQGIGPNARLHALIDSQQFQNWLFQAVNVDVNYGLAVVANSPGACLVLSASPGQSDLRRSHFQRSLRSCLESAIGKTGKHSRAAAAMGMHWLDGCMYHIERYAAKIAKELPAGPRA